MHKSIPELMVYSDIKFKFNPMNRNIVIDDDSAYVTAIDETCNRIICKMGMM